MELLSLVRRVKVAREPHIGIWTVGFMAKDQEYGGLKTPVERGRERERDALLLVFGFFLLASPI